MTSKSKNTNLLVKSDQRYRKMTVLKQMQTCKIAGLSTKKTAMKEFNGLTCNIGQHHASIGTRNALMMGQNCELDVCMTSSDKRGTKPQKIAEMQFLKR
ncbi:hypothetical protein KY290_018557 [Solanum tuberosum]|nr:hypothetical protein KY289_017675 [Solanum tuberosum]KAH0762484.1 hypothetical protein KY290_018557 [Solanum tuberosum]